MAARDRLRTFCVIPHIVRDHPSFQIVQEDHIVYDAQGKTISFDFTHVMSPAHNLNQIIIAPLLEEIREGKNCALMVASPSSDESYAVAMELYSNFLPLLFRAAVSCSIAHLSAVEIKKDGKTLTDMFRMMRVSSLQELDTEEVLRAASSTHWGTVMDLMSQRGASGGDTALIVRVEMEGYGEVVVADVGSSPELLNLTTLVLRSGNCFGAVKTIPPRVAFTSALKNVVPPQGTVHIVTIPDTAVNPTQTLRLLHFCSGMEREVAGISGPALDVTGSSDTLASEMYVSNITSPRGKQRVHRAKPSRAVTESSGDRSQQVSDAAWREELVTGLLNTSAPERRQGVPPPHPALSSSSMTIITPSKREEQLAAKLTHCDATIKDQQQHILALQHELRRVQAKLSECETSLKEKSSEIRAVDEAARSSRKKEQEAAELVSKLLGRISSLESRMTDDNSGLHEVKQRNQDLSALNSALKEQVSQLATKLRAAEKRETTRLRENTLAHLGGAVSPPSAHRIAKNGADKVRGKGTAAAEPSLASPHATSREDERQEIAALLQSIKQFRNMSSKLELENQSLRLRLQQQEALVNSATKSTGPSRDEPTNGMGAVATEGNAEHKGTSGKVSSFLERECSLLKQQVQYFTEEVARVQKDKDALQQLIALHPRSVDIPDSVRSVVAAITNGCASLLVQLQVLESADASSKRPRMSEATRTLVAQHTAAINALKSAVEEIASRKSTISQGGIPSTAGAADCDMLTHFLIFEVERLAHLRAFVPTFAQLCVAVEHLKQCSTSPSRKR